LISNKLISLIIIKILGFTERAKEV